MTPEQLARLKKEITGGARAQEFAALVAKGDDAGVAALLNKQAAVGAYTPIAEPPAEPTESAAEAIFGPGVQIEHMDVAAALRPTKAADDAAANLEASK